MNADASATPRPEVRAYVIAQKSPPDENKRQRFRDEFNSIRIFSVTLSRGEYNFPPGLTTQSIPRASAICSSHSVRPLYLYIIHSALFLCLFLSTRLRYIYEHIAYISGQYTPRVPIYYTSYWFARAGRTL